jgi:hypothetical protein
MATLLTSCFNVLLNLYGYYVLLDNETAIVYKNFWESKDYILQFTSNMTVYIYSLLLFKQVIFLRIWTQSLSTIIENHFV